MYNLGIDIGGTFIKYALVNYRGYPNFKYWRINLKECPLHDKLA